MTQSEFAKLLKRFAANPVTSTIGRHVYLWHGEEDRLHGMCSSGVLDTLDLHILAAAATRTPFDQAEASQILQRLIDGWLNKNLNQARQHIVFVTGCDLLARYRTPLTSLFQWSSDTVMFVLIVNNLQTHSPAVQMPDYVTFQPLGTFTYLKEIVNEYAIIGAEG